MHYMFFGSDAPGSGAIRAATKAVHSRFLDAAAPGVEILMSGPLLGAEGRECGSLMVLRAETIESVQAFLRDEPYHQAGLFGTTTLLPWVWKRGNPDA